MLTWGTEGSAFAHGPIFFITDYNPEHNEDLKILGKVQLPNKLLA
jgi:hypothetical protein